MLAVEVDGCGDAQLGVAALLQLVGSSGASAFNHASTNCIPRAGGYAADANRSLGLPSNFNLPATV